MYATLDPIIESFPGSGWVTVGDGRYGKDARYLFDRGCEVLATDISDVLLKEAGDSGFMPNWKCENAEKLTFADERFDFAFCKESYHHFPRPMLALYEMLRVSREGIVLIEPNDSYQPTSPFMLVGRGLKNSINRLLGKKQIRAEYEDSGNYVYRISRREIEKAALGLNYRAIAFLGFNDAFLPGVEREPLSRSGPLYRKLRLLIAAKNILCRVGLMDYAQLTAVIFKNAPSVEVEARLKGAGFSFYRLAPNPYA